MNGDGADSSVTATTPRPLTARTRGLLSKMLRKSPSTVKHTKTKSTVGISSKDFFAQEAMSGTLLSPTEIYADQSTVPPVPEITTIQFQTLKAGITGEGNSPDVQSPASTVTKRPMTISAGQNQQGQYPPLAHALVETEAGDNGMEHAEPLSKSKSMNAGSSSSEYQRRRPAMLKLDGATDNTPCAKLQRTGAPPIPKSAIAYSTTKDDDGNGSGDSDDAFFGLKPSTATQATGEGKRRSPLWRTKLSFTNSRRPDSRRQRHQSFDERSVDITAHPQLYPQSPLVSVPTAPPTSHGRPSALAPPGKSLGSLLAGLEEDTRGDASSGVPTDEALERDDSVGDLDNLDMEFLLTIQRNTALHARRQRRRDARRNTVSFVGGSRAAAARALSGSAEPESLDFAAIRSSQAGDVGGNAEIASTQNSLGSGGTGGSDGGGQSAVSDEELATVVHIHQHMPKRIAGGHASSETVFDELHANPSNSALPAPSFGDARSASPNSSGSLHRYSSTPLPPPPPDSSLACSSSSNNGHARPLTATRQLGTAETHAAYSIETASRPLTSRLSSILTTPSTSASQAPHGSLLPHTPKLPNAAAAAAHSMLRPPTTSIPPVPSLSLSLSRPRHLSVNPTSRLPHSNETAGPPVFSPTARYNASSSASTTPVADRFPDDPALHSSSSRSATMMQSRSSYTQWAEPHSNLCRPQLGIYTDIASPTGSVTSLSSGSTTAVSSSIDAMLSLPATASHRYPPLPGARKFSQQHICTQALLSPTSSPDILSRSATNLPGRSSVDTSVSVGAAPMSISQSKSMRKMPFGRHNLDSPVGSLSDALPRPSNAECAVATLVDDPLARRKIRDQLASSRAFDRLLEEDEGFTMAISLTPSNVGMKY